MPAVLVLSILSTVYSLAALVSLVALVRWWNDAGLSAPAVVVPLALVVPLLIVLELVRFLLEAIIDGTFALFPGARPPEQTRRRA